ncbi:hypothetical protein [uncultured Imperialibacter sp.]|uniref:hypothetical protein n=1 Tax=Imperialibacter sp. TaxID=2038411 RepID=UPI0030DDCAA8|tara:strand:- start:621 stop:1313 length:693 start_codon:yes stop_codon:yes gene_type:complete
MKVIISAVLFFGLNAAFGQITSDDIEIYVEGLSEEYEQKFRSASEQIPDALNKLGITSATKSVKLQVIYQDSQINFIRFIVDFDADSALLQSKYKQHQRSTQVYGDGGVSVLLIEDLFSVLAQIKISAAKDGYALDNEIIGFRNVVRLIDKKGDWIQFYSNNSMNRYGFIQTSFNNIVHMKVNGVDFELESNNYKALSEIKVFWVNRVVGLDGKPTPSYYFLKFFNLLDE